MTLTEAQRQQMIPGTGPCNHPDGKLEDIKNYGDETIAVRCRACGDVFSKAWCMGCKVERWCSVVNAAGTERYCTQDCQKNHAAARAKMSYAEQLADRRGPR